MEPAEPYAVSPQAAADRLDVNVSTIYKNFGAAMRCGKIRNFKVGKARRIVWRSLLEYIEGANEST